MRHTLALVGLGLCLSCNRGGEPPPLPDQDPSGLQIFPPDNPWNTAIDDPVAFPVHPLSDAYLASIGLETGLHPDFGSDLAFGIPFVIVGDGQAPAEVAFENVKESDPGPYPIPEDAPIEGGGDRHVIVVDRDQSLLYELFAAERVGPLSWTAGSGAIFDLNSNALRPDFFTSADAAGLPIFPGLVKADEILVAQELTHALRFTVSQTQRAFIHPATHFASESTDPSLPPMGLRVRLKADVDISSFPEDCQVILRGLKTYGMIVADNGSDWFISGTSDLRWNDDTLRELGRITGRDFEAVVTGDLITD